MSTIDDIKDRIDIIDIISETVKLRRTGKNYTGFCPFHQNTRTPAFVVFPETATWHCFSCNEGGDMFKFLMKKEGWDFPQTLKHLAERAGVEITPYSPQQQAQVEENEGLRGLLEEAVNFFRHHLVSSPGGAAALKYLQDRGVTASTIETFELGYAPASWDTCLNYFKQKNYSIDDLLQVGLITDRPGEAGYYDRFRNRIIFPIRDGQGKMSGFGARALDTDDIPKYLNSPQTVLFDKGKTLYGLHLARKAIRSQNQAVIVEGYMDVIIPFQQGFTNTISPMGTALNEYQVRQIKKLTRRIVLALDSDAAGEKATLRGLEVAHQALDHAPDITFDPRGLMRAEARLQADLRVTTLPPGKDPDEVALSDPELWRQIIDKAKPIVIHVMETLSANHDLDDPKEKGTIANQVMQLIEDVPNAVEREDYKQRLARLLKVDERSLIGTGTSQTRPRRRSHFQKSNQYSVIDIGEENQPVNIIQALEKHSLRLLLRNPDALNQLDRRLQEAGLSRFSPQDFVSANHETLAIIIRQSLEQDQYDPQQFILVKIDREILELAEDLLLPMALGEPERGKIAEDLIKTVMKLRSMRVDESLNQLRFLQEDLQNQGGASLKTYQDIVLQYSKTKARLDHALRRRVDFD